MKSKTERARAEMLMRMYRRDCAALELRDVQERGKLGRYYLCSRSFIWAEVVVLRGGSLLVHGDMDTVVFSNYHRPWRARQVIAWMANKNSDYGYATGKAGLGGSIAKCFDDEVAFSRVLEFRRRGTIDKGVARELTDLLRAGTDQREFSTRMYELTLDPELCSLGTVTDPRVFMALAVCQRLMDLLEVYDKDLLRKKSRKWYADCDADTPWWAIPGGAGQQDPRQINA